MASGDAGERLHFAHFKTARGGGAGAGKRAARTTLTMSSMISRLRAGSTPILGLGGAMAIVHDVHGAGGVHERSEAPPKKRFIAFFFAAHRVKLFYRLFTHADMVEYQFVLHFMRLLELRTRVKHTQEMARVIASP